MSTPGAFSPELAVVLDGDAQLLPLAFAHFVPLLRAAEARRDNKRGLLKRRVAKWTVVRSSQQHLGRCFKRRVASGAFRAKMMQPQHFQHLHSLLCCQKRNNISLRAH